MSTDKLPAWPERKRGQLLVNYNHDLADAYRARMEALKDYTQHHSDCPRVTTRVPTPLANKIINGTTTEAERGDYARLVRLASNCTCGLDALLAACERKEE